MIVYDSRNVLLYEDEQDATNKFDLYDKVCATSLKGGLGVTSIIVMCEGMKTETRFMWDRNEETWELCL